MNRRQRKRLARQNQMLDTAMSIIVKDGLEALTIARLAGELDAAVGALYRYFPSKKALLVGLQLRAIDLFREDMIADLAQVDRALAERGLNAEKDGAALLCKLMTCMYAFLLDAVRAPARHGLIDALISTPVNVLEGEDIKVVNVPLRDILTRVAALMDHAAILETMAPGNALQRTYILWATFHGLDHFRKRDRMEPPELQSPALTRTTIRTLLSGWGASSNTIDRAFALWSQIFTTLNGADKMDF